MSPAPANKNSTNRRIDLGIGVALWIASAVVGGLYVPAFTRAGGRPGFYQEQFGPAVVYACGGGYTNLNAEAIPSLTAFLLVQRDNVPCEDVLSRVEPRPLNSMHRAFRYLLMTVAWCWRLSGRVAWSALTPLYALLYGTTVVLAYAIFRQGVGPVIAAVLAVALSVSTLHLAYLANLRDYSKAPFVLALVLIAARLVAPPPSRRRILTLAAVAGIVTGIGTGFRNDLLVAVPAFLTLFAGLLPVRPGEAARLKLSAAALYLAAFLLALSPMLSIYQTGGGNSSQHLVLLGLSRPFSEALGLENEGLYEWSDSPRDELTHAMVSSYADLRLGQHTNLALYGPEYDRAATRYLATIVSNFPADMLTRVYASVLKLFALPSDATSLRPPLAVRGRALLRLYHARTLLLTPLTSVWPWAIVATVACLSVWNVRLGLFSMLLVVYLCAYPALQFGERHFFHLEFIAWWALGFLLSQALAVGAAVVNRARRARWVAAVRPAAGWRRGVMMAAFLWLGAAILALTPLWGLRVFQQRHVRSLLQDYVAAPREPLSIAATPLGNGRVLVDSPARLETVRQALRSDVVHAEYIVAEFGGAQCNSIDIDATLRYAATDPQVDFTRTVDVRPPLSAAVTQLFAPAYYHRPGGDPTWRTGYTLSGLELPESSADCLVRLSRVRDPPTLPVLLSLLLPPRWPDATLYETMSGIESRTNVEETPKLYTFPAGLTVGRRQLMSQLDGFSAHDVVLQSPAFHMNGAEWRVLDAGDSTRRGPYSYLAEMRSRFAKKGSIVVAQGRLETGGISFGLVRGSDWVAQATVERRGDFVVAVRTPEDGDYAVVLANNLRGRSLDNRLTITRAGWIADAVQP